MKVITAQSLIFKRYRSSQHPLKLFPTCCVFISRSLSTASNSEGSSASRSQVPFSQPPVQNSVLNRKRFTGWHSAHWVREPESELLYDWRFTTNKFILAISHLIFTTSVFPLYTCGYGSYVTFSLPREWVWFTIAAGPRQRIHSQVRIPRDSLPHFTVSDSRLPQPGGPGPRIYIPQEQGGPVILPDTDWVLFSSPPTTRRVAVEVFKPASTRDWLGRPSCLQDHSSARTTQKTPFPLLWSNCCICLATGCITPFPAVSLWLQRRV
jgi:hypothetical protein